ncbi:hypothetical protein BDW02DRAFT_483952, partial [Decorospora gaudefroyi]
EDATDTMMFGISIDDFMVRWRSHSGYYGATNLIWKSDACTGVDDKPFGWDFKSACRRHDFGTRNYKHQHRWTKHNKKRVDHKFKHDMLDQCHHGPCRSMAKLYYWGAKHFG